MSISKHKGAIKPLKKSSFRRRIKHQACWGLKELKNELFAKSPLLDTYGSLENFHESVLGHKIDYVINPRSALVSQPHMYAEARRKESTSEQTI